MSEDFWIRAINSSLAECLVAALAEGARNGRDGPEATLALMRMAMDRRATELRTVQTGSGGQSRDESVETIRRMKKIFDAIEADARSRLGLAVQSRSEQ